jgi:anti-anti-sigma factor
MKLGDLRIRVHPGELEHTVAVSGEMDIATAPAFSYAIGELCGAGVNKIALDLAALSFIDARGLAAILEARELCEEHRCGFSVRRESRQVRRMFELAGMLDELSCTAPG